MGATVLVARTSRYVIDVNRGEGDVDAEVVEGARADVRLHHGLVWRTTSDGEPALSRRLSVRELEERLDLVWRPYHRELAAIVERKRARFGIAVVLAAHSMPSIDRGTRRDAVESVRSRADVVPGTRGRRSVGRAIHRRGRGARRRAGVDRTARRSLRRGLHDAALRPPGRERPRDPGRALAQALPRRGDPPSAAELRGRARLVQLAREQARGARRAVSSRGVFVGL